MSDDILITTRHIYTVPAWSGDIGFCARGARTWFARHDLDWSDFVLNGLPASVLLATDDALAQQVVDHATDEAEASAEVNNG